MNILILCSGTRNKIVQYFKNTLAGIGRVIAGDMSPYAPALYDADGYYILPHIRHPEYLDRVLEICQKEQIRGVLSLIDPELSLLAENQDRFAQLGVTLIGSSAELCELAFHKYHMYQWLTSHGYACARSYLDKDAFFRDVDAGIISYPVVVKPVCGSASQAVCIAQDQQTVDFLFSQHEDMMIQQYLSGQEIGADIYADLLTGEVISIFTKKKLLMRSGETDKAVSFKDARLFSLIRHFVEETGYQGPLDMDLFEINGTYYISEVNPRFGGGYPHAYECGVDHMGMILKNLQGIANTSRIGCYEEGAVMMKYVEVMVKR